MTYREIKALYEAGLITKTDANRKIQWKNANSLLTLPLIA